ncbi:MAG: hypothetical protein JRN66_07025 [Nitrososphaerota archaeon]|nr:hypothetical protein [Nitrososphaerota archaeon]
MATAITIHGQPAPGGEPTLPSRAGQKDGLNLTHFQIGYLLPKTGV